MPAQLQGEVVQARSYADGSWAVYTRKAYEADWTKFATWCGEHGLTHPPADVSIQNRGVLIGLG